MYFRPNKKGNNLTVGICSKFPRHFVGGSGESFYLILFKKTNNLLSMYVTTCREHIFLLYEQKDSFLHTIWDSTEFPSRAQQSFFSVCERILVLVIGLETKGGISVASACISVLNGISIITSLQLGLALLKRNSPFLLRSDKYSEYYFCMCTPTGHSSVNN